MWERVKCVLVKEFLQVFRDPRMKTVIFLSPLIQVLIFGYAANTDIQNIPTVVYDLDNTKESRQVIREFSFSKYFDLDYYVDTDKEAKDLIDRSAASVILRFNHGFGQQLQGNRSARFQVIVDGTDSNTASIVLGYVGNIVGRLNSRWLKERIAIYAAGATYRPRVDLRDLSWFNENLLSRYYYIPGVIALIVTVITLLLTAMAIVREKEIGTMEQLIVSPIRPFELILGKMLPFAVIALMIVILVTVVGVLWFGVPVRGSILLLLGCTIVYLLTSLGFGLYISTISSTQQEAVMSTFLFYFPASLLSGFMFPIANMPVVVQWLTFLNPLRYYLVILRGVFLKGVGFYVLWPQILVLLILGLSVFTLSTLKFKSKLG